LQTQDS